MNSEVTVRTLSVRRDEPKEIKSLRDLVETSAELYGDKILYIYKRGEARYSFSYNDYRRDLYRLGEGMSRIGLMGRTVAVIGESCPEYMTAYIAAVSGGGVIVPLDRDLGHAEIARFADLSGAEAVFYTEQFNDVLPSLAEQMPQVRYFIPIAPAEGSDTTDGSSSAGDAVILPYSELLALGDKAMEEGDRSFLDYDCTADMSQMSALLFTSGTTGTSKGVMLSHANIVASVNAASRGTIFGPDNTFVDLLPMHHSYEITCGHLGAANLGGTVYINDSLKNTLRSITTFKPDSLIVVPLYVETMHKRIWAEIARKGMTRRVRALMKASSAMHRAGIDIRRKLFKQILDGLGGNLRYIICGGAPLSPELVRDFDAFGIEICEGYGITECSPLIAVNRHGKVRLRSVGQPVDNCEVRIADPSADGTGEIEARGRNVMLGYFGNEEATAEVFTEDGWFRTGDVGCMDADGYIYITGRKKNNIILSNGKNIFPEEIEEHLYTSPLIGECVVIGRKNSAGDTRITAVIYPSDEAVELEGKSEEEKLALIRDAVNTINRSLPVYKQVRDVELRSEEFEKTTTRKIKRFLVK
ncbi:MAG: AMP-dependent synthetase [Oscillospiraceae bacterium]|nr:MAG: AMP-dependent synthetase [Oscillospiraceae bacterium]